MTTFLRVCEVFEVRAARLVHGLDSGIYAKLHAKDRKLHKAG